MNEIRYTDNALLNQPEPAAARFSAPANPEFYRQSDVPPEYSSENRSEKKVRQAAVLIPLLKQNDSWHVMFIRRTVNRHDRHSGQVAFPGGSRELKDHSLVETALRETREEVGIRPENIRVLGSLQPYLTVSWFDVTPVVGLVAWPCTMKLQTSEVARAFTIPLDWLRNSNNFELRERQPNSTSEQPARRYPVVYYKEFDGETLWGASARMTLNFLKALEDQKFLLPG